MLKVTSIDEIRERACQLVELPGWEPGETFVARLRRASLLSLVQQGAIPNQLLSVVYKLIGSEGQYNPMSDATPEEFGQFVEMMNAVCKAVLVEPTYEDVGDCLSDVQRSAIFLYAQQGVEALKLFRRRQELAAQTSSDGEGVSLEA